MRLPDWAWGVACVWLRYYAVFRRSLVYSAVTTFVEPVLYLLSFGVGVAGIVGTVKTGGTTLSYRSFVFSGIIAQTVLFQGFYEGAFGAFVRMYYQRIFQAIATTPITLSEVLWGELVWDATKATVAAEVVALLGVVTGEFAPASLVTLLPVCFVSALLFSGLGLLSAARAKNIEHLSYPQYLLVFPMFMFCGVFFPIENLPRAFQIAAWALPLTSVVSLVRTLTLGLPLQPWSLPILAVWLAVLVVFSRRAMTRRLVK